MRSDVMRSKDFYYVDDLFKSLGLYVEGMPARRVVEILESGVIKYLGHYISQNDEDNKALFNTGCKGIHMGDLKGFTLTDMYRLSVAADNYDKQHQIGEYFVSVMRWNLNLQRKRVPVVVDFYEIHKDKAIEFLCKSKMDDLTSIILKSINAVDPKLLEGEGYAEFTFKVSDLTRTSLGSELLLRITRALNAIKKNYKEFDYVYFDNHKVLNAYEWALNSYNIADKALRYYIDTLRIEGVNLMDHVKEDFKTDLKHRRAAAKRALIEDLDIKVGDIVLFSLAPLSQACPYMNVPYSILGIDENGEAVIDDSNMRGLNYNSLYLAKIVNYTEDYLVIRIKYERMKQTTCLSIPIKWELLLPNLRDGLPSPGEKFGFKKFRIKRRDDEFLQALNRVPLLLTEANCTSVKKPLFPIIYNMF